MNSDQAIAIAKAAAEAKGWPWQAPLHVTRRRRFFLFGPASWHISTNAASRGGDVRVSVTSGRDELWSRVLLATNHMPNKPLVPTRNGEAPLLAAQRRRYIANG
jgi:hypothetical protein